MNEISGEFKVERRRILTTGLLPSCVDLFVNPALPRRQVFVSFSGTSFPVLGTYLLECSFQGKLTYRQPVSAQSGAFAAPTERIALTQGLLLMARGAALTEAPEDGIQATIFGAVTQRTILPHTLFVTADKISLRLVKQYSSGADDIDVFFACKSFLA